MRLLWGSLDSIVDHLLGSVTLQDLLLGRLPGHEPERNRPALLQTAADTAGKDPS